MGQTMYIALRNGDDNDFYAYSYLAYDDVMPSTPIARNGFPFTDGSPQWELLNNYKSHGDAFQLKNVANGLCLVPIGSLAHSMTVGFATCRTDQPKYYWRLADNGGHQDTMYGSIQNINTGGHLKARGGTGISCSQTDPTPTGTEIFAGVANSDCEPIQEFHLMKQFPYGIQGTYTPVDIPIGTYMCLHDDCRNTNDGLGYMSIPGTGIAKKGWLIDLVITQVHSSGINYDLTLTVGSMSYAYQIGLLFPSTSSASTKDSIKKFYLTFNPPDVDYYYAGGGTGSSNPEARYVLEALVGMLKASSIWEPDHANLSQQEKLTWRTDGIEYGGGLYYTGSIVFQKVERECSSFSDCDDSSNAICSNGFCRTCGNGFSKVVTTGGREFCYYSTKEDWDASAFVCSEIGLSLVQILDEDKMNDIAAVAGKDYTWLGLTCDAGSECDTSFDGGVVNWLDQGWKWSGSQGGNFYGGTHAMGHGYYDPASYGSSTPPMILGSDGTIVGGGALERCAHWWGGTALWGPQNCASGKYGALCE